jgi:HK97 family phage portal protein
MGILNRLQNLLRVRRLDTVRYMNPGILRFVPTDLRLTTDEKLSVSACYAAVRAIVDPLAASNWDVFVSNGGRRQNLADGEVFYRLNVRANRNLPAVAAKELVITHALLHGDGYALILRDNSGRVIGWDPLESPRMSKGWREDDQGGTIVYLYAQPNGETVEIPAVDIIHLRGPSVTDLFGGDSQVSRATVAIATAAAMERFGQHYFANGAHLGGYIKLPGRLRTPEDVARLKADWGSKYRGLNKTGETAALEDGAEFVPLTPDAEKLQLVAPRAFQVEDISRFFGVPLVKLMVKEAATGYGANLSTLNEQFSRDTLTPWSKRIAQEFGFKLLPQRAPWAEVEVNLAWLTRGDAESRARVRQLDIQSGVITRDEARAEEGRTALPGGIGSVVTVGTSVVSLKDALEPKPPPAPPARPAPQEDPAADPESPEDAPQDQPQDAQPDPEVQNLARAGIRLALDSHARRWRARAKDVVPEKLPAARDELRSKLAADLHGFHRYLTDGQFAALATEVEAGVEPTKAVDHVLAA